MATKVTSSSNRSSRKSAKPVTTAKGRGNRSAVSNATVSSGRGGSSPKPTNRVTSASNRTSTGSARVTGTPRPALPPSPRGGSLTAPVNPRRGEAAARLAESARGSRGSGVRAGQSGAQRPARPNSRTSADGQPTPTKGGALVKSPSGALVKSPSGASVKPGGRGRLGRGAAGIIDAAMRVGLGQDPGQALTEVAAGQAGAKLGSMVPGNPLVKAIGSGAGYLGGSFLAGRAFDGIKNNNGGRPRPNQGRTNVDPYGSSPTRKLTNSGGSARSIRNGAQLAAEMEGRPIPASKPPTPRPSTSRPTAATPPSRPSAPPSAPAARQSAASSPRSTGNSPRSASSSPRSAPASAPKAPPAAAKPAPKAPEEPNLYNVPRTGVPKFRTDMNPLGKKIVGTTNFSKSVPSERAFDTNSDYSSSLSIPDKKKRKS